MFLLTDTLNIISNRFNYFPNLALIIFIHLKVLHHLYKEQRVPQVILRMH